MCSVNTKLPRIPLRETHRDASAWPIPPRIEMSSPLSGGIQRGTRQNGPGLQSTPRGVDVRRAQNDLNSPNCMILRHLPQTVRGGLLLGVERTQWDRCGCTRLCAFLLAPHRRIIGLRDSLQCNTIRVSCRPPTLLIGRTREPRPPAHPATPSGPPIPATTTFHPIQNPVHCGWTSLFALGNRFATFPGGTCWI